VGSKRPEHTPGGRGRPALLIALLASVLALLAPTPAAAQVPKSFWGVIPILDPGPEEFETMARGNVGTLRLLVVWPDIEPAPDQYDWSRLDYFFGYAAGNGVEILPFAYGTPNWAGVDCGGLDPKTCERVPPLSGAAQAAWVDFLQDMAARYGPQGSFWSDPSDAYDPSYVPMTRVQIWNEPSSQFYWRQKPNPKKYGALVKTSDDALEAVDPSIRIVLAGVFPDPVMGGSIPYTKFLAKLYDVKGIAGAFDSAGFHPYATSIKRLKKQVKTIRKLMREGGVKSKPLYITELGWGSAPPQKDRPLLKGPEGQRTLLEQSFDLLESRAGQWKLEGVVWYSWRDPGFDLEQCLFCSSAGLFDVDGNPKPSWSSFVQQTGGSP
jgi:hypothetical protein